MFEAGVLQKFSFYPPHLSLMALGLEHLSILKGAALKLYYLFNFNGYGNYNKPKAYSTLLRALWQKHE